MKKRDRYQEIKEELKRRRENTRYFTRAWYNMFCRCRAARAAALDFGIDESYKDGIVTLFRSYDPVYASDFYNKNSGCYCEFLSIVC